jgi:hypothetical protein
VLALLTVGCGTAQEKPNVRSLPTAEEALAISSRAVDCEWKAASRYNDPYYTVSALAQRIVGICAVELVEMRRAFGLSLHDPEIELDEFKQAVEIVEAVRKLKRYCNHLITRKKLTNPIFDRPLGLVDLLLLQWAVE